MSPPTYILLKFDQKFDHFDSPFPRWKKTDRNRVHIRICGFTPEQPPLKGFYFRFRFELQDGSFLFRHCLLHTTKAAPTLTQERPCQFLRRPLRDDGHNHLSIDHVKWIASATRIAFGVVEGRELDFNYRLARVQRSDNE